MLAVVEAEPADDERVAVPVDWLPLALALDRESEDEGAPEVTVDMLALPVALEETRTEESMTNGGV